MFGFEVRPKRASRGSRNGVIAKICYQSKHCWPSLSYGYLFKRLVAILGHFLHLLGLSWPLLGALGCSWGTLGEPLAALGVPLEAIWGSWGSLRPLLEASWTDLARP